MPSAVAQEGQIRCTLKLMASISGLARAVLHRGDSSLAVLRLSNSTYACQQPISVHTFGVLRAGMRSWLSAGQRPCLPLQAILWLGSIKKNSGGTQQLQFKQQLVDTEGLCQDISVLQPFVRNFGSSAQILCCSAALTGRCGCSQAHTGREKGLDIGCCGCRRSGLKERAVVKEC